MRERLGRIASREERETVELWTDSVHWGNLWLDQQSATLSSEQFWCPDWRGGMLDWALCGIGARDRCCVIASGWCTSVQDANCSKARFRRRCFPISCVVRNLASCRGGGTRRVVCLNCWGRAACIGCARGDDLRRHTRVKGVWGREQLDRAWLPLDSWERGWYGGTLTDRRIADSGLRVKTETVEDTTRRIRMTEPQGNAIPREFIITRTSW